MKSLISAEDLFRRLNDVQILEVGAKTANATQAQHALYAFEQGHIPTAQYVDLTQHFSQQGTDLDYQHPNLTEMRNSLSHFGLNSNQPIVIYDRENHIWATRLWWVLQAFGITNVYVLHGGFKAWQTQDYPLEQGSHQATQSKTHHDFNLNFQAQYFADLNDVKAVVNGPQDAQLVNVLRPVVFRGEELRYARAGHIPGSINIPFAQFLDADGFFKDSFSNFQADFGLNLNRDIIIYCGSGITASGAAFALQQTQAKSIKIYDGSMSEWSADPKLPLQTMIE
ncbi:hypothetical protein A3K93_05450 [Acinetobacter sp. NCu2D-2]|uniref:sulfurtransferase n=1 Tax=Acinetobacter sp. NCu2D-2 TaxID=1608473 RepID=UPI0007CDD5D4|nr:sulfurtransferase [Acinetobacter sp. NCu2D-2]ANF81681.1 hypothetical protein A3K93_05450 [Acinetobacter sp. NCu2D-2]